MTVSTIEKWLAGVTGLDAHTLGPQAVADAVKRRMAACGLTKESDYLERLNLAPAELSAAADELQALIETILVPETWFFRDREPFVFLAQYVNTTWLAAHSHDRLQVLSVPCSSGEEPYSIAMTLQSMGLRADRYQIDAMDISPALLRKAETGAYGSNSFRGGLLEHCERYFTLEGTTRIVRPEVRAGIRFIHGNIMGPQGFAAEQSYDIIFCRNLLIYQHEEARRHIIATLDRYLKPEGLLFVGHAEMMSLLTDRYEPVRHSRAFAYCKIKTRPCSAAPESGAAYLPKWRDHAFRVAGTRFTTPEAWSRPTTATVEPQLAEAIPSSESRLETESRLDRVRALADQGRLDEAAAICQDLLKENPQQAEVHFLLGVIRAAAGQIQAAEECLNRVLYLDADCYEALIHLALLKARRGDEAGAERLRRHAKRVRDHEKVTT